MFKWTSNLELGHRGGLVNTKLSLVLLLVKPHAQQTRHYFRLHCPIHNLQGTSVGLQAPANFAAHARQHCLLVTFCPNLRVFHFRNMVSSWSTVFSDPWPTTVETHASHLHQVEGFRTLHLWNQPWEAHAPCSLQRVKAGDRLEKGPLGSLWSTKSPPIAEMSSFYERYQAYKFNVMKDKSSGKRWLSETTSRNV